MTLPTPRLIVTLTPEDIKHLAQAIIIARLDLSSYTFYSPGPPTVAAPILDGVRRSTELVRSWQEWAGQNVMEPWGELEEESEVVAEPE